MAKQTKKTQHFDFAGRHFYVEGREMDGMAWEQIEVAVEQRDFLTARAAAIYRTVTKLNMDGKEQRLRPRPDGSMQFPKVIDLESKKKLTDALLEVICRWEPELSAMYEDAFEKYVSEEEEGFTQNPPTDTPKGE